VNRRTLLQTLAALIFGPTLSETTAITTTTRGPRITLIQDTDDFVTWGSTCWRLNESGETEVEEVGSVPVSVFNEHAQEIVKRVAPRRLSRGMGCTSQAYDATEGGSVSVRATFSTDYRSRSLKYYFAHHEH